MSTENSKDRLEVRPDGFILIAEGRPPVNVAWDQVRGIAAYRRDPDGRDLLCLEFRISAGCEYVEINEEMQQYQDMLDAMYEAFPKISRDWWQEIAQTYGTNRMTIHGLPLADQMRPAPAERYLQAAEMKKQHSRATKLQFIYVLAGLVVAAGVQQLLAWLIARAHDVQWDDILALTAWPVALVVMACRMWPRPRAFFALLLGFYVIDGIMAAVTGSAAPSLPGLILQGKLGYLSILGGEILLGMGVMAYYDWLNPAKRR
jgi:hypothetical protein